MQIQVLKKKQGLAQSQMILKSLLPKKRKRKSQLLKRSAKLTKEMFQLPRRRRLKRMLILLLQTTSLWGVSLGMLTMNGLDVSLRRLAN